MKSQIVTLFYCLLLSSCNTIFNKKDKIKDCLPGIYINQSAGSYSIAFDTLVVSKESEDGNSFSIERKVSFQKIRHGVLQSREYHLENWLAIYDDTKKILTETRKGKIISCDPAKKKLYVNSSVYQKIE